MDCARTALSEQSDANGEIEDEEEEEEEEEEENDDDDNDCIVDEDACEEL